MAIAVFTKYFVDFLKITLNASSMDREKGLVNENNWFNYLMSFRETLNLKTAKFESFRGQRR